MNMKAQAEEIECSTCIEAKYAKSQSTEDVSKGIIDHVVESDVRGTNIPISSGSTRYLITFLVEKNRSAKASLAK